MKRRFLTCFLFHVLLIASTAQNDVMMQAFYWDVPVDSENKNGSWWDTLMVKADDLKMEGFTALWVPSPSKGNWGIVDMGYGIYDHYDLGNYFQKGSTETRFGSRDELEAMISAMHDISGNKPKIDLYADIILNHIYGGNDNLENNPSVKKYVFDEAFRNGSQFVAYPSNEIKWIIKNAEPGNYHIKIKGYNHDYSVTVGNRGYDLQIFINNGNASNNYTWELEPNDGLGNYNIFPESGSTIRGFMHHKNDIDEYLLNVPEKADIHIYLTSKRISGKNWAWADQTAGLYPGEVWFNGINLAPQRIEAHTSTGLKFPHHSGVGEENFSWNYTHFHPADENDWLGDWGSSDEIITNTKGYGNDLNTFSEIVQERMNNWGKWLVENIGFDGFRLDFVRGFQEQYAASWVKNLPIENGNQRFVVGEYWGSGQRIFNWVNKMTDLGVNVNAFDFPLKDILTQLCNSNSDFDIRKLNNAGMVRNNSGYSLPGTSVVTFLENHDTGKEHDKWVIKDWNMGYAYILTHEGRPCIFYPHYYGVTLEDYHYTGNRVEIPNSVNRDIRNLIFIRKTYIDGTLEVLSQTGNPHPPENISNVYVARRQGNANKKGALIVINNADSTKGLWVDSSPVGWENLSNSILVNAFDKNQKTTVAADGRVWVEAPGRGYAVYVAEDDYVAFE